MDVKLKTFPCLFYSCFNFAEEFLAPHINFQLNLHVLETILIKPSKNVFLLKKSQMARRYQTINQRVTNTTRLLAESPSYFFDCFNNVAEENSSMHREHAVLLHWKKG
jgi:hypothetical protein